jgi:SAM-dependent methyltransferase
MSDHSVNPTQRFSGRVANYIRYRPDYPPIVFEHLIAQTGLSALSTVADIGSGTGIFTRHLLDIGAKVYAVEPNTEMRAAADAVLNGYPNYESVNGGANSTTLQNQAVNLIVCAQAFHWFNTAATKEEFTRILQPAGYVALIWNNRQTDADEFSKAYDSLLKAHSSDYNEVNHQNLNKSDFDTFFGSDQYSFSVFPNVQLFDESGLIGRAYSSSYVPELESPAGQQFLTKLKAIFAQYQENGKVKFQYHTEVYLGQIEGN